MDRLARYRESPPHARRIALEYSTRAPQRSQCNGLIPDQPGRHRFDPESLGQKKFISQFLTRTTSPIFGDFHRTIIRSTITPLPMPPITRPPSPANAVNLPNRHRNSRAPARSSRLDCQRDCKIRGIRSRFVHCAPYESHLTLGEADLNSRSAVSPSGVRYSYSTADSICTPRPANLMAKSFLSKRITVTGSPAWSGAKSKRLQTEASPIITQDSQSRLAPTDRIQDLRNSG